MTMAGGRTLLRLSLVGSWNGVRRFLWQLVSGLTHFGITKDPNCADVHLRILYELLQFWELRRVMVSNELLVYVSMDAVHTRLYDRRTLFTTRISLSTSTARLFAWTMRLYSGFE